MFCPKCGSPIGDDAKFCPKCGAQIARRVSGERRPDQPSDGQTGGSVPSQPAKHYAPQNEPITPAGGTGETPRFDERRSAGASPRHDPSQGLGAAPGASLLSRVQNASSHQQVLLGIDVVLFLLVTFFPWVGSSYLGQDGSVSLPKLAFEGVRLIAQSNQVSSYAYSFGAGATFQRAVGLVFVVAMTAGIGWLLAVRGLYDDAKKDLDGKAPAGGGARYVVALAILVQVLVWIGVAIVKASLKNQYLDLSSLGNGVMRTTLWVWVSLLVGAGSLYLRKQ